MIGDDALEEEEEEDAAHGGGASGLSLRLSSGLSSRPRLQPHPHPHPPLPSPPPGPSSSLCLSLPLPRGLPQGLHPSPRVGGAAEPSGLPLDPDPRAGEVGVHGIDAAGAPLTFRAAAEPDPLGLAFADGPELPAGAGGGAGLHGRAPPGDLRPEG